MKTINQSNVSLFKVKFSKNRAKNSMGSRFFEEQVLKFKTGRPQFFTALAVYTLPMLFSLKLYIPVG
jgi:hypothetical protein